MAIAFVRKLATEATSTTNNATIAMTTTAAVTAGDFIVGFVANHLGGLFVVTGVSGGGLTWSVDSTETGSSTLGVSVFSAQAPSGLAIGTTITATISGSSSRKVMGLYEFSGVATSAPLGVTAINSGTTGNPAVTLGSAATAGDLVFAAYEHNKTSTSGTQTPFAGFNNLGSAVAGTTSWTEGYAQYVVDATGVADAAGYTPSNDTTTAWLAAAACYHAASSNQTVPPPAATASASAPVPASQVRIPPAAATASATVPTPTAKLQVAPAAATASGSAPTPAIQVRVLPPAATASASAPVPTVSGGAAGQTVSPSAATAAASEPTPAVQLVIPVPLIPVYPGSTTYPSSQIWPGGEPYASASSPVAAVTLGVSVAVAAASASALVPAVQVKVAPAAATASASASVPTVGTTAGTTVSAPAAAASASAFVPSIQLTVSFAAATASASSPLPGTVGNRLQLQVPAPAAIAAASAPTPIVSAPTVSPVATASASSPIPSLQVSVLIPVGTAGASAPVPTLVIPVPQVVSPPVALAGAFALFPINASASSHGWAIGGAWSSAWGFKPQTPEPMMVDVITVPPQPNEPLR